MDKSSLSLVQLLLMLSQHLLHSYTNPCTSPTACLKLLWLAFWKAYIFVIKYKYTSSLLSWWQNFSLPPFYILLFVYLNDFNFCMIGTGLYPEQLSCGSLFPKSFRTRHLTAAEFITLNNLFIFNFLEWVLNFFVEFNALIFLQWHAWQSQLGQGLVHGLFMTS